MNQSYKPNTHNTVSPYLIVAGASATIAFLERVFGAVELRRFPDATYRRALAAGGTSVQEPVKKEDADKRGGVKDAGGTTWWIATKLE